MARDVRIAACSRTTVRLHLDGIAAPSVADGRQPVPQQRTLRPVIAMQVPAATFVAVALPISVGTVGELRFMVVPSRPPGAVEAQQRTAPFEGRTHVSRGGSFVGNAHSPSLPLDDDERTRQPIAPNLLDHESRADAPNQRWVGDTSELIVANSGRIFLALRRRPRRHSTLGYASPAQHERAARMALAAQANCLRKRIKHRTLENT